MTPQESQSIDRQAAIALFLSHLQEQLWDLVSVVSSTTHVFVQSKETASVKYAASVLLEELMIHGLGPDRPALILESYRASALRTLYPDLTYQERLGLCGLGLSGEVGEVTDLLKKHLYHRSGKPLNIDRLKDELGDVLWYVVVLLDTVGLTLEEVMAANIVKNEKRHPHGFQPHYTSDSHDSEGGQPS